MTAIPGQRESSGQSEDEVVAGLPPADGTGDRPATKRTLARWASRSSWCWSALATLAVGLLHVQWPELWRDELASWSIASRSVSEMLATAQNVDGAELPYYAALHYWMAAFGSSILSMRLLSVLAMAGAAAFVTLIARKVAGTRAGILAGFLFAAVPSISRFAQEVRFYALAMLLAALATWLLIRALERPSWSRWAWYAAAMAAVGYSDMVAMSLLAGHGAWTALRWWRSRDPRLARFAAGAVASVAVCVPLVLLGSREADSQVWWVPHIGFGAGDASPAWFAANLFYSGRVAAVVLVLAALAWATRDRVTVGYLTALTLGPLVAVWLVSQGKISYFFPRYVLFTLIGVVVLAGITVSRLGSWLGSWLERSRLGGFWSRGAPLWCVPVVVVFAVVAALGAGDQGTIREQGAHEWASYPAQVIHGIFDYDQAAQIIGANARPGDGVAYTDGPQNSEQVNLGVGYYLGSHLRPGVPAPRVLFVAKPAAQSSGLYPVPCAQPARCAGDQSRVWLVGNFPVWDPFTLLVPAEANVLRQHYTVSNRWQVGANLTVVLLTRSASSRW